MKAILSISLALGAIWYFAPVQSMHEAVQVVQEQTVANKIPADVALSEASAASLSADYFNLLPAEDQRWVIDRAADAVAQGRIEVRDLKFHIEELATVRQLAVMERDLPEHEDETSTL